MVLHSPPLDDILRLQACASQFWIGMTRSSPDYRWCLCIFLSSPLSRGPEENLATAILGDSGSQGLGEEILDELVSSLMLVRVITNAASGCFRGLLLLQLPAKCAGLRPSLRTYSP